MGARKNSPRLDARPSSKLSGLTPNDSFAEPLNLPFCLLRPGSTLRRKKQRTRRLKQRLARGGPYLSYPVVSKNTNELRTGAVIRKKEDRV